MQCFVAYGLLFDLTPPIHYKISCDTQNVRKNWEL